MTVAARIEVHRALARMSRIRRAGCKRRFGKSVDRGRRADMSALVAGAICPRSWCRCIACVWRLVDWSVVESWFHNESGSIHALRADWCWRERLDPRARW
jgi:hypothetical protein